MKPIPQISSGPRVARDKTHSLREHSTSPVTDYSYYGTEETMSSSAAIAEKGLSELRTFRKTSRDFFKAEAGREYVNEALFFTSIASVAAWPLAVLIRELTRMMI